MILIIAPNLEPSLCGVSDYAIELRRLFKNQQIDVFIIALSDAYIENVQIDQFSLRIPRKFNNNYKLKRTIECVQQLQPTEIYFNLVSYGYQAKGFPLYLLKIFRLLKKPITIIAHELWMGNFKNETIKNKIIGLIQKQLLIKLFRLSNIKCIFVSTDIFKNILKSVEIDAKTLPVFSNIPIHIAHEDQISSSQTVTFILFGSIAFHLDVQAFIHFILKEFLHKGKYVVINHVGIYRGHINEWESIKKNLSSHGVIFKEYGIVAPTIISKLLQSADYGLTSYMLPFWSKSGSIAAMLAHGLPVISISKYMPLEQHTDNVELNSRIFQITILGENNFINSIQKIEKNISYNELIFKKMIEENPIF
ncbi:MAG: hypothetical protein IKD55_06245 [Sediminibacterium sp.]|nr:hypothetical protein [Sediminibacterium sp.]